VKKNLSRWQLKGHLYEDGKQLLNEKLSWGKRVFGHEKNLVGRGPGHGLRIRVGAELRPSTLR